MNTRENSEVPTPKYFVRTSIKPKDSEESREVAVPKYFLRTPIKPKDSDPTIFLLFLIGGCLGALGGFGLICHATGSYYNNSSDFFLGVLLFVVGGAFAFVGLITLSTKSTLNSAYEKMYKIAEPKPSDAQMDHWLKSDLKNIYQVALQKLDLLPEQVLGDPNDPIVVVGPSIGAQAASGQDGVIRFSWHDVVVVYLTDYHLAAYKCSIDMKNGLPTQESTQEYHYADVVAVSTQTDNSRVFKVVVDGKDKPLANYQKFALSVASGEKIEVAISFPQLDDLIKNARLAPTGAENAVKLIRSRLREKKGGIQE